MKRHILLLLTLSVARGSAAAADAFSGLRCDSDIAKALIGRHMPDEPVDATEAHYKNIGLKHHGADELEWGNQIWWQICGALYSMLLDKRDVVRDVLKYPAAPGTAAFAGACKGVQGELTGTVETRAGAADLPATTAWKIDDKKKAFVPVPVDGLLCSKDGLLDEAR